MGAFSDSVGTVTLSAGSITGSSGVLTGTSYVLNNATGTTSASAILGGAVTLAKSGAGTAILSGANTYSGATTVTAGVLNIQNATALGTVAGGVTVSTGAALQIQGGITVGAEAITINGTGIATDGALRNISGTNIYGGLLTLGRATRINSDADTLTLSNAGTITGKDFALSVGGAGNTTINSIIGIGEGALTKDGTGTLTLGGVNTFTGLTTVTAGTLAYGVTDALGTGRVTVNGGALNMGAFSDTMGTVTLSAGSITGSSGVLTGTSFVLNNATGTTTTLSAILGGAGTLAMSGAGTAVLSGANTYSGATTISAGILQLGNASALGTTAGTTNLSGGTLDLNGQTVGAEAIVFSGTSALINSSTTVASLSGGISGLAGGSTIGGSGDLTLSGVITSTSSGAGWSKTGIGTLTLTGTNTFTKAITVTAGVLNIQNASALGTLTNAATVTANAALQIQGGISVGAKPLTLNGSGISNDGALRNISGTNTYGGLLTLGSATRINSDAGTLALSNAGTITGNTFGLTVGGAGNTTISSSIGTGAGTLTKDGTGTLTLGGVNTFTGLTTVTAGTLAYGVTNALSTSAVTVNGGTLNMGAFSDSVGTVTLSAGSITGSSGVLTGTSYVLNNATGTTTTLSAILGGVGTLAMSGAGTAILSGANTYSGATNITAGTLQIGNAGTTGSLSSSSAITDNAALVFNRSNALSQGTDFGTISGTGTVSQAGGGITTLNASNSYAGLTTVTAGVLNIQSALALGTSAAGTTVSAGAALQIQGGITVAAEALTLNGGGIATDGALRNISNNNSYGGLVTLASASRSNSDSGTLTLSNAGTIGGAYVLSVGGAGNTAIASIIGTSSLTKDGAGTLTLTGANTHSTTTISAGILQVGGGGTVGTLGSGSVTDNAALVFNRSDSYGGTLSNAISGSGALTLSAGTLTLGGSNTYAGATTVSAGTLKLGATGALGNGTSNTSGVSVASGAVLDLAGISPTAAAGLTLSGTGITSGGALVNSSATLATYSGLLTLGGSTSIVAGSGDIVLSNPGSVTGVGNNLSVGGAHTTTLASVINTGGGTLTMAGSGSLVLTGQNLFTGATTINSGGTLQLGTGGTSGSVSTSSGILNNGVLVFNRSNANAFSHVISGSGSVTQTGSGTLTLTGTNTYSGITTITNGTLQIGDGFTDGSIASSSGIVLTSALVYNVTSSSNYSHVIGGAGSLSKTGVGTLTLSGASTFTGGITASAGTLKATSDAAALGTGAATLTLSGGSLQLANDTGLTFNRNTTVAADTTITSDRLTSGAGVTDTLGTLTLGAQTLSLAAGSYVATGTAGLTFGATTLTGAATFNPATGTNLTLGAVGGSSTGFTKQGAGQLTLSAAGSFTGGVTVNAGVLQLGNAGALNATTGSENAVAFGVGSTGTLRLNGNNAVVSNLSSHVTPGAPIIENANASAATLTVGNSTNQSGSFAGVLQNGTGGGTLGLTKAGTGSLTLSGTNTYTGVTTLNAGTLKLGNAAALGSTTGGTLVTTGAALDLLGQTVGAEALTLSGTGTASGGALINSDGTTASLSGAITLAANSSVGTVSQMTLSGVIGDSGAAKSLTKVGAGIVTLSNTNTYTGATSVSVGTLNVTGSLNAGSAVAVSGAATLSGTGSIFGGVTVSSGGIITAGNGTSGALAIGGALTFSSGGTIHIGTLSGYTSTAALGITGNLTLNGGAGAVTLALQGGALSNGTYHLVSHTNTLSDLSGLSVSGPNIGVRQSGLLTNNTGMLDYVVAGDTPYWTGAADGNWSASTSVNNWQLITAGTATYFLASDASLFNDSASGSGTVTVNITGNVNPATTTFNNSTRDYVLQQTGGFGITTGSLTKSGSRSLTITNANSYTGGTILNAGSLLIGNNAALGSVAGDTLTLNGGTLSSDSTTARTLANNLVMGGDVTLGHATKTGTLTFTGTVDLDGSTHTLTTASDVELSGIVSGSNGGLAKAGAGTLTLSGANTFTSDVSLSAGTLAINSSSSLGAVGGMLTFTGSSTLQATADISVTRDYIINSGVTATIDTTTTHLLDNDGIISGSGNLTKTGTGTLVLSGSNSYTGTTTISAGTLQIGDAGGDGSISASANVVNNSALVYDLAGSSTFGKVISGSGTFTKSGAGTLTLTGATNSWGGHTTISSGTLQLGDGTTDSSIASSSGITNDGSLIFNVAGSSSYAHAIEGSGGLTKTGAGTLTLTGTSTYTGNTTLVAGTLIIATAASMGNESNSLVYAGNATLQSNMDRTVARGWILNSGATANADTHGYALEMNGIISGAGALNKVGAGTMTVTNTNTYTGTTTLSAGTLSVAADSGLGTAPGSVTAGKLVLNGGTLAATDTFTLNSNRSMALPVTSTIEVSAAKTLTYGGIMDGAGGLNKSGDGTLELSGRNKFAGGTALSAGTITINSDASLGSYGSDSGALTFAGDATEKLAANVTTTRSYVLNSGITGTIDTNGYKLEHDGVISGSGSLTKAGTGTLVLDGPNTFTGATTIAGGTLQIGDGVSDGSIATSSGITNYGSLVFNVTADTSYAQGIGGTGTLTKTGAGTLTLTGTSTYTGNTTLVAGTLIIATAASMGAESNSLVYAGNATLQSNMDRSVARGWIINSGATANADTHSYALEMNGIISGAGALNKIGTGTMTVTNTNTYTGTTTLSAGTLSVAADSGLGAAPGSVTANQLVLNGGTLAATTGFTLNSNRGVSLASDSTIDVASGQSLSYGGIMAGTGGFTKTGSGTLELLGANTFEGNITLDAGTLTVNSGQSLGTYINGQTNGELIFSGNATERLAADVTTGRAFVLNPGITGTIDTNGHTLEHNGVISGSGSLTKTGAGSLILDGSNTFTGILTISSGTLLVRCGSNTGVIGSTSGVTNNGALIYSVGATSSHTLGAPIGGSGTLTKSGTGALTLTGTNTYTGKTTISSGTLALGADGSIDNTSEVNLGTGGNTFDVTAKTGGYSVGTLRGSGTVLGSLSVSTELAIGNSPGTATFDDLTLNATSIFSYQLTGGDVTANLANVNGNLTLITGTVLNLIQLGTYTVNDKFTLFAYTTGHLTGTFSGLANNSSFITLDGAWKIDYEDTTAGLNGGSGTSFVTIMAIPEPGALTLGGLGLLALLRRRRA
ncbi:MAG: autotransporter-associated beta strand repeat-containing protein [Verrucomicrobiota bacterium]